MKLPGGIVGKVSYILMSAIATIAAIGVTVGSAAFGYAALGVLLVIVLLPVWWLIRLTENHPEVAILEGAEFLVYQQIKLAQKGVGTLPDAAPETPEGVNALPSPEDIEAASLPDPEPIEDPKPRSRRKEGL